MNHCDAKIQPRNLTCEFLSLPDLCLVKYTTMYWIGSRPASNQYAPISSQDPKSESPDARDTDSPHLDEAFEKFEGPSRFTTSAYTRAVLIAPWLMTVLFATLSAILFVRLQKEMRLGTYETSFETDFRKSISQAYPTRQQS